ncbi:MAG: hypothetical protein IT364_03515 [Candidatus Hydrogenedentes bacterium]|nr:hypothetical protein [Candidatus Hydrogenedentota bacterium]
MSLFSRLLGYATKEEAAGARMSGPKAWVVPPTRNCESMLRALPILFPDGGFVYFEGTTESRFAAWAEAHAVVPPLKIAYGTLWPRPDFFHIPLEANLMEEAAVLIKQHGIRQPTIHVHVHDGAKVLLEWHDAFEDDPMYVSTALSRERVEAFASAMDVGPVSSVTSESGTHDD